jgi:predicted lipase
MSKMNKTSFDAKNANISDKFIHVLRNTQKQHNLPSNIETEQCILHKIYTAGCYTNAAYIISDLHPYTLETAQHPDTKKIIENYADSTEVIYDSSQNPLVCAVVFQNPNKITLAFHGINFANKAHHLKNFESELTPSKIGPGQYHAGFLKLFNSILPNLLSFLNQHNCFYAGKSIAIYGHSMGGALAQLMTQYLQYTHQNIQPETIVFGSPKVMCPLAAKAYNSKNQNHTIRVENPLDLAIYMPKQSMGYGNVETSLIIPSTHASMARNHDLEGYLESILEFKKKLKQHNIQSMSLAQYKNATKRFNILYPLSQASPHIKIKNTTFYEFINLMTYNISKGVHSIINLLPFNK